jgi:hypothetical protein
MIYDEESRLHEDKMLIASDLITKLNATQKPDCVLQAMRLISARLVNSGNTLVALYAQKLPYDWTFDGASMLRTSYDVMLQGLYIMIDPKQRTQRAELYLDFMHIERQQRIDLVDRNDTDVARHISNSPLRAETSPLIKKRFDEVKRNYLTKSGNVRKNWHPLNNLKEVAQAVYLGPEYEWLQSTLGKAVHSSPLALEEGTVLPSHQLVNWQFDIILRILGAKMEHVGHALTSQENVHVTLAQENFLNSTS